MQSPAPILLPPPKFLSAAERTALRLAHRRETRRIPGDRIKVILLWDHGWTARHIAAFLWMSPALVRHVVRVYIQKREPPTRRVRAPQPVPPEPYGTLRLTQLQSGIVRTRIVMTPTSCGQQSHESADDA